MNTNIAPHEFGVGILADDLTSAADGAGPFVCAGRRASIGRGRRPLAALPVQGIDMASRSMLPSQAAGQVMGSTRAGGIIATGGDTMQAILDRLGIHEFEILGELAPGFPLGRATQQDGSDLLLAMKAGGFGDDQALRRACLGLRNGLPATQETLQARQ